MRLITVSGIRGSGKTTLIRALIHSAREKDEATAAVVVNEEGEASYDKAFVRTHDIAVAYLRGG
jgi:G3E family GTPase